MSKRGRRTVAYIGFALLAVAVAALHTAHFAGRPFRQDEAWIVFGALEKHSLTDITRWVAVNIHPPLWVALADGWVDAFGPSETMTRLLSTLLTLLTLALVFRLGSDLFDYRVGLAGVFLLAAFPIFEFYTHEFRPYAAFLAGTIGLQFTFLRWLRQPDFWRGLAFVLVGVAALYVHFFAVYVLVALAVCFVLLVRWQRGLYLRALGLFAAILLSYLGWLLPFMHAVLVTNPGGIEYALDSNWQTVSSLYRLLALRPFPLGTLLALVAVLTPVPALRPGATGRPTIFRLASWRKWYPLLLAALIMALAFAVNRLVPNLTQRTSVIVLPSLAIFLAFGFAALPRPAQLALIVLVVPPMLGFLDYEITGPQAEVATFIAQDYHAGDPIIVNVPIVPRHVAVLYYVQQRTQAPPDRIWQVLEPRQPYLDFLPYSPINLMQDTSDNTLERLRRFIGSVERVWYVDRDRGTRFSGAILDVLNENYEVVQSKVWPKEYTVMEFQRRAGAQ
ncbi:MAG: glycosyltransferase family 39 protein [Chloroflexi bacterium]|nr:glycosyltransferase family 39 protein [Chloroflexota bacterium]